MRNTTSKTNLRMLTHLLNFLYQRLRLKSLREKFSLPVILLISLSLLVSTLMFFISTSQTQRILLEQQTQEDLSRVRLRLQESAEAIAIAADLLQKDPQLLQAVMEDDLSTLNQRAVDVRERFNLDLLQIYNQNGEARVNLVTGNLYQIPGIRGQVPWVRQTTFLILQNNAVLAYRADLPDNRGSIIVAIDLYSQLQRILSLERFASDFALMVQGQTYLTNPAMPTQVGMQQGMYVQNILFDIAQTRLRLLAARPTADLARVTQVGWLAMTLSVVLTGFLLTLLTRTVIQAIIQPIQTLAQAANQVAVGNLEQRVRLGPLAYSHSIGNQDELEALAHAFNQMVAELKTFYTNLETKVNQRTAELQAQALRLQISMSIGQQITSNLDLDLLLPQIAQLLQQQLGYYYVAIFLGGTKTLALKAEFGPANHQFEKLPPPYKTYILHEGIIGLAALNHQQYYLEDIFKDTQRLHLEAAPRTRSEVALPLIVNRNVLGVLNIQNDRVAAFNAEELALLEALANQIAIAINNASVYHLEKSRRQFAEHLKQIAHTLANDTDPLDILPEVLRQLSEIVPYARGLIVTCETEKARALALHGFPNMVHPENLTIARAEEHLYREIYTSHRVRLLTDAAAQFTDWQMPYNLPPARAWLGVPLLHGQRVIGVLSLTRLTTTVFTPDEVALASAFAGQITIALQTAQLYRTIQDLSVPIPPSAMLSLPNAV